MFFRPIYFRIEELVNPKLIKEFGADKCWEMLDGRLLNLIDQLRGDFGAIGINYGGLVDCGLRDWRNPTTGATSSQHCHGRAFDLHILGMEQTTDNYEDVRKKLLKDDRYKELNFEGGINWLHIDVGNRSYREFPAS